jgi:hypothetical protein
VLFPEYAGKTFGCERNGTANLFMMFAPRRLATCQSHGSPHRRWAGPRKIFKSPLHLIRDAQYAIDAGDTAFPPGLRKLPLRACGIGGRRDRLADATLRAYGYKLDTELDALLRVTPTHAAGKKLQGGIKECRRHMFVFFLGNRAIPPSIFRKVTNCLRSEWAAHLYADIRSVIETARRRAVGVLDASGQPSTACRGLKPQPSQIHRGEQLQGHP